MTTVPSPVGLAYQATFTVGLYILTSAKFVAHKVAYTLWSKSHPFSLQCDF